MQLKMWSIAVAMNAICKQGTLILAVKAMKISSREVFTVLPVHLDELCGRVTEGKTFENPQSRP